MNLNETKVNASKIETSTAKGEYHSFINCDGVKLKKGLEVKSFLFLENQFFVNNYKDTYILLRSFTLLFSYLFISGIILYFLLPKEIIEYVKSKEGAAGIIAFYITTSLATYWRFRGKFGAQWKYCADLYNSISMNILQESDATHIIYSRLTLALDCIQLNLWNHKSFHYTFQIALAQSLHYRYLKYENKTAPLKEGNTNIFTSNNWKEYTGEEFQKFINGEKTIEDAYKIISEFQNDLDCLILDNKIINFTPHSKNSTDLSVNY